MRTNCDGEEGEENERGEIIIIWISNEFIAMVTYEETEGNKMDELMRDLLKALHT